MKENSVKCCNVSSLNTEPMTLPDATRFCYLSFVFFGCKATRCGLLERQQPYNHLQPWKWSASSWGKTNVELLIRLTHSFTPSWLGCATAASEGKKSKRSATLSTHAIQLRSLIFWKQWRTPKKVYLKMLFCAISSIWYQSKCCPCVHVFVLLLSLLI